MPQYRALLLVPHLLHHSKRSRLNAKLRVDQQIVQLLHLIGHLADQPPQDLHAPHRMPLLLQRLVLHRLQLHQDTLDPSLLRRIFSCSLFFL